MSKLVGLKQRSAYMELVAALQQGFTPVRMQSVQSELFHSHKQHVKEKVGNMILISCTKEHIPSGQQGTGEMKSIGEQYTSF